MTRASAKRIALGGLVVVAVYRHTTAEGDFNFNSFGIDYAYDLDAEQDRLLKRLLKVLTDEDLQDTERLVYRFSYGLSETSTIKLIP